MRGGWHSFSPGWARMRFVSHTIGGTKRFLSFGGGFTNPFCCNENERDGITEVNKCMHFDQEILGEGRLKR